MSEEGFRLFLNASIIRYLSNSRQTSKRTFQANVVGSVHYDRGDCHDVPKRLDANEKWRMGRERKGNK